MTLTKHERELLDWLALEEFSQYGECEGRALNSLVAKGIAQIHKPGEHQSGFISQGTGSLHRAVSLTEAGLALVKRLRNG